ncbi:hypothetical protein M407DRAFT_241579 [Tulasnella calospora MUT 4182]|uniref:Uncharacterized protein n=1 Tax=Tulasnella calospora MUT 4182 TaxID=1051891 RepID=A0A0C3QU95_9AGAM|nr:hypothetical protein M407DRAFT_241579 [Tulasnella calospora MUT 4182]
MGLSSVAEYITLASSPPFTICSEREGLRSNASLDQVASSRWGSRMQCCHFRLLRIAKNAYTHTQRSSYLNAKPRTRLCPQTPKISPTLLRDVRPFSLDST